MKIRIFRILILGLLVSGVLWINACKPKQQPPQQPKQTFTNCILFDDMTAGARYEYPATPDVPVNQTGVSVKLGDSPFPPLIPPSPVPFVEVQGGLDKRLRIQNPRVRFIFDAPIEGISFVYETTGGFVYLEVNGVASPHLINFRPLNGTTLDGADVISNERKVKLCSHQSGGIYSLVISGQELWIDSVCPFYCR